MTTTWSQDQDDQNSFVSREVQLRRGWTIITPSTLEPVYIGEDNEVVKQAPMKPRYSNSARLFACSMDVFLFLVLCLLVSGLVWYLRLPR